MGDPAPNPTNPAPANPAPADPAAPVTPPANPAPADPANPTQPNQPDDGKGGKDAILADLARERDKRQTLEQTVSEMQTAQQAQMDAIAKALGLKSDNTPPDPAKLAEQITAEQGKTAEAETRATTAERKLGVVLAALEHDGNYTALLDSTSFLDSVKDIDSTDSAAIGEAVKKAVTDNDHFKASPTAPPFPGGPRKTAGKPETGPGLPRLRDAYAQSSK